MVGIRALMAGVKKKSLEGGAPSYAPPFSGNAGTLVREVSLL